jgi:antitoxin CptB
MTETDETRRKRLMMRSARRGIKEMDIILGRYGAAQLATMDAATLDIYEALLNENDHDLYQWVTGQVAPPEGFAALIDTIALHAGAAARG